MDSGALHQARIKQGGQAGGRRRGRGRVLAGHRRMSLIVVDLIVVDVEAHLDLVVVIR